MKPETRKYLLKKRIDELSLWILLLGIVVLLITAIFGGFLALITELLLICNLYYWLDDYNFRVWQNSFKDSHVKINNTVLFKKIFYFMDLPLLIITTIVLIILRLHSFEKFIIAFTFISCICLLNRTIENYFWFFPGLFKSKKQYYFLVYTLTLIIFAIFCLFYYLNIYLFIGAFVILLILYTISLDIMAQLARTLPK